MSGIKKMTSVKTENMPVAESYRNILNFKLLAMHFERITQLFQHRLILENLSKSFTIPST